MKRVYWFFVLLWVMFSLAFVSAIPQTINVHGKLSNSSGALTGTYSMNFSIYDSYSGGSLLYSEVQDVSTDGSGVYNAILDNVDLPFSAQYYLGVTVESDAEMTPRINLTSSPYAFRAQNVSSSGIIFESNLNVGSYNVTSTGGWFKGFFNWLVGSGSSSYLSFNGSQLDFNESFLNDTIDSRAGGIGSFVPYTGANQNVVIGNNNFSVNSSTLFVDSGTGRVGIGTTSPDQKLDIVGNLALGGNAAVLALGEIGKIGFVSRDGSNFATGEKGSITLYDDSNHAWSGLESYEDTKMQFNVFEDNVEKTVITIKSTGNVGIGTTSPGAKLEIVDNTAPNIMLKQTQSGRDESGRIQFSESGASVFDIHYSGSNDELTFETAGTDLMTIERSGNVGIGTTSPGSKLEVNGTAGGLTVDVAGTMPTVNTTSGNVTISSFGGSVVIRLG